MESSLKKEHKIKMLESISSFQKNLKKYNLEEVINLLKKMPDGEKVLVLDGELKKSARKILCAIGVLVYKNIANQTVISFGGEVNTSIKVDRLKSTPKINYYSLDELINFINLTPENENSIFLETYDENEGSILRGMKKKTKKFLQKRGFAVQTTLHPDTLLNQIKISW